MRPAICATLGAVALAAAALQFPAHAAPPHAAPHDNDPVAPFALADQVYYVGASDIAAYLIRTRAGLILIDGGYEDTAPQILANIRTLGFDPKQVKILLNTHGHYDHAAGLARVKAATGATFWSNALDGPLIARGGKADMLFGDRFTFPPVKPDRLFKDGEKITLGGMTLTAHITGGHTRGCTTWTWTATDHGRPVQALVMCSNSVLPGYKLVGTQTYPGQAADYRRSYATWQSLPCDLFLASHAGNFKMAAKRAAMTPSGPNPFIDPAGCKAYFARGKAAFEAEYAKQAAVAH